MYQPEDFEVITVPGLGEFVRPAADARRPRETDVHADIHQAGDVIEADFTVISEVTSEPPADRTTIASPAPPPSVLTRVLDRVRGRQPSATHQRIREELLETVAQQRQAARSAYAEWEKEMKRTTDSMEAEIQHNTDRSTS